MVHATAAFMYQVTSIKVIRNPALSLKEGTKKWKRKIKLTVKHLLNPSSIKMSSNIQSGDAGSADIFVPGKNRRKYVLSVKPKMRGLKDLFELLKCRNLRGHPLLSFNP